MKKINIGCGLSSYSKWDNYDGSPTLWLQRVFFLSSLFKRFITPKFPEQILYGDVVNGLPIQSNSVDLVYTSHMLEHLSLEDFSLAIREILRILKPGGILRAVIPDLEVEINKYVNNPSSSASTDFLKNTLLGIEQRPRGLSKAIRGVFGNSNHLWMWDYKGISQELLDVGYTEIRRACFNDSDIVDFKDIEDFERWDKCLGIQCIKPL
jgi:predicted SAM-dependent methyltransferase